MLAWVCLQEPRLVGLLRRETAAESLVSTVHAHRLEADVAPVEPAAVEAILPVGTGGTVRRLVRPASSLKETLCVVRCILGAALFCAAVLLLRRFPAVVLLRMRVLAVLANPAHAFSRGVAVVVVPHDCTSASAVSFFA